MPEQIALSKEDLKEILRANQETLLEVVKELKKPNEVEQAEIDRQAREMRAKNEERKINGGNMLAEIEAKRALQKICTHEHRNGDTHAVFIQEKTGPGYFICQKNQCKIRPEPRPADDDPRLDRGAIYDNAQFNRLFQKATNNEVFG